MKKFYPLAIVVAILMIGIAWGNMSCATKSPEFVRTGVVRTQGNPDLAAAVLTSRRTLPRFIDRYQHPQPGDRAFGVLARFTSSQGPVRAWVHVDRYADNTFTGHLDSDVETEPPLRKGATVSISKDDVDDWVYQENGKQVGGLTLKVLRGI